MCEYIYLIYNHVIIQDHGKHGNYNKNLACLLTKYINLHKR
jgi:hypothetical protein